MTDDPCHRDSTVEEQAALYALGALGGVEAKQFERSLDTASGAVQGLVGAFQDVAAELAFAGAMIAPPAPLKERLMARIAVEPQEAPAAKPFVFVRASDRDWRKVEPGVSIKVLFYDSAAHRVTTLVRLAPGDGSAPIDMSRWRSFTSWKAAVSASESSFRPATTTGRNRRRSIRLHTASMVASPSSCLPPTTSRSVSTHVHLPPPP